MKIFIDTVNVEEIKKYADLGILFGVTTNPTFMKQSGYTDTEKMIKDIRKALGSGEIHVEVTGKTADEIIEKATVLHNKDNGLIFKIPFNVEGIRATSILQRLNIPCNLHLVFSPNQAIIADQVGAAYICPLIGRIDDIGYDGLSAIRDIADVVRNVDVMASSIRNPKHVWMIAKERVAAITIPPKIIELMISHPLTEKGIELFE